MENNKITKKPDGLSLDVDNENVKNSIKILNQTTFDSLVDPENVLFEKLIHPNRQDVLGLLQIYGLCFSNYGLLLDREFILKKAEETIIYVARNKRGEIIATARGKFLEEESLFFFEISEVAVHTKYEIISAASCCIKRVIRTGRKIAKEQIPIVFWKEWVDGAILYI